MRQSSRREAAKRSEVEFVLKVLEFPMKNIVAIVYRCFPGVLNVVAVAVLTKVDDELKESATWSFGKWLVSRLRLSATLDSASSSIHMQKRGVRTEVLLPSTIYEYTFTAILYYSR